MKTKITKVKWAKNLTLSQWSLERKKIEGLDNLDIVRIGASDVSVCTGSNKWKCPQRLFYHLTGYHSGFFITKKTVAGHLEESNIVQHFEAWNPDNEQQYLIDVGDKVRHRKLNKANYFLLNSDYPNSFVSLDYTVANNTFSPITGEKYPNGMPVELKTAEGFYYKMWTDGITQPYLEQIQYQMLLTGQPMALLLVFVDKEDLKVKEVYADANLQQHILSKVNEFADKVKVGKMALQGMKDRKSVV
jgi:predicted phage-related endonuclease